MAAPSPGTLETWARAFARGNHAALERRLAWDGIAPGEAAVALDDENAGAPSLTATEKRLLNAVEIEARALARSGGTANDLGTQVPFAEIFEPWRRAARKIWSALPEAHWVAPGARLDLERVLLEQLAVASQQTVYERFTEYRRLDSAAGLYRRFVERILGSHLLELYATAPVLLRRSVGLVLDWQSSVRELTGRLSADASDIAATFGSGGGLPELSAVVPLHADPHDGGRRVLQLVLAFGSGEAVRVVYKPRSVSLEARISGLLDWMSGHGCTVAPRPVRTLERSGYGWQEWVVQEDAGSAAEVQCYFRRAGAWVCLAYVLGGHDLHGENVIAGRGGPIVVDGEMFLQPEELRLGSEQSAHRDARGATGSCLDSGLLKDPLTRPPAWSAGLAGLEAAPARILSDRFPVWTNLGGDDLGLDAGTKWSEPGANALRFHGEILGPDQHSDDMLTGFAVAYRFLLAQRSALLAPDGPLARLRDVPVRVLFRASQHYATVLSLLAAPRNQRSGSRASLLLEGLLVIFAAATERPAVWPLVAEERDALERLDIPRFTVPSDARTLVAASGEPIEGLCARSGYEAMQDRLEASSESDLERQSTLLRRALARGAAERAGRLTAPATEFDDEALRLGRLLSGELQEGAPLPRARGLFGGGCGPALFLAALAAAHDDAEFKPSAMRVLEAELAAESRRDRAKEPGSLARRGSLRWTLTACARLLGESVLLDAADALADDSHEPGLPAEAPCDLQGGAAAALLGVLALYRSRPRAALLARARELGEHLLRTQNADGSWFSDRQALCGMAHGAAGIARALAALDRDVADGRFLAAAARGLAFEATLFDVGKGSWPRLWSKPGGNRRAVFLEAWCHGAPGCGLARAFMPARIRPELRAEIELAARATSAAQPAAADHLCCGAIGRAAALVTTGELLRREQWIVSGHALARSALHAAHARGAWSLGAQAGGDPGAEWGFLHGLSGIGYQLVSLSAPGRLPQPLVLELPGERPREEAATWTS